jgi:hypothetical protein
VRGESGSFSGCPPVEGSEEAAEFCGGGIFEEFLHGAGPEELSLMQADGLECMSEDEFGFVGREDEVCPCSPSDFLDRVPEVGFSDGVDVSEWFVHEQPICAGDESSGDGESGGFTEREL